MSSKKQDSKGDAKPSFEKKVKVPAKVGVDKMSDLSFVAGKGALKGAFTVIVIGENLTRQFTIHHPIGVTDLDDEDWVLTQTAEIQSLLARSEDPDADRIASARAKERVDLAVARGLLKETPAQSGTYFFPNGEERDAVLKVAREKANNEYKLAKAAITAKGEVGDTARKKLQARDVTHFLDDKSKDNELKLREFWKDPKVSAAVLEKFPQNYRTRGGPQAGQSQSSCVAKGDSLDQARAADAILYNIVSGRLAFRRFKAVVMGEGPVQPNV